MRSHFAPRRASAASTVAEKSSQLLNTGVIARVDSSAATSCVVVVASERLPERARRAQDAVREECGVDERLSLAREVQEIGRRRIDRARDRAPRQVGVLGAETPFACRLGRKFDPRRHAREQPAERLEVADGTPIGCRPACSTGIRALSVPLARFFSTGSASRVITLTQYARSLP